MEKICIVKLRKNMTSPGALGQTCGQETCAGDGQTGLGSSVLVSEGPHMSAVPGQTVVTEREKDEEERTVSLMLTPEQIQSLQSNPTLRACFKGAGAKGFAAARQLNDTVIFQFTVEPPPPVRLLRMEEVVDMLRISKGYLRKIIQRGDLKSYKLGRLRRVMFDDVLSYLEGSQSQVVASIRRQASKSKLSQSGIA